jgi:hypothetical protein
MSGGSYDYAYSRVEQMADDMERRERRDAPDVDRGARVYDSGAHRLLTVEESAPIIARVAAERTWFTGLLRLVAKAMRDVEWVDSSDCSPGDEVEAIDAVRAYVGDDLIPRSVVIARADTCLKGIQERPLMYGGSWEGVEIATLDALAERDFALAWPEKEPGEIGARWNRACNMVYPETRNGTLMAALDRNDVTEDATRGEILNQVVQGFLDLNSGFHAFLRDEKKP